MQKLPIVDGWKWLKLAFQKGLENGWKSGKSQWKVREFWNIPHCWKSRALTQIWARHEKCLLLFRPAQQQRTVISWEVQIWQVLTNDEADLDPGFPRSGKSQWKMKKIQGQGKVREFWVESGKFVIMEKVREKSGNFITTGLIFKC